MASPQPHHPHGRHYQPPAAILLIYPATLFLGSLFSILSPTAHHHRGTSPDASYTSDANHPSSSDPSTSPAVNYFARKNNIFNQYFVKIGWFWSTVAFGTLLSQLRHRTTTTNNKNKLPQALLRYALATFFWYLTTQWFFGPGIIDRAFVLTGGRCERVAADQEHRHHLGFHEEGEGLGRVVLEEMFSATACKAAGGHWMGGHDVSGHVFMLVLATGMLVFEGVGLFGVGFGGEGEDENVKEKTTDCDGGGDSEQGLWARRFVWGVAGLGWWMLFMTAIWFHTWLEKVSFILLLVLRC